MCPTVVHKEAATGILTNTFINTVESAKAKREYKYSLYEQADLCVSFNFCHLLVFCLKSSSHFNLWPLAARPSGHQSHSQRRREQVKEEGEGSVASGGIHLNPSDQEEGLG